GLIDAILDIPETATSAQIRDAYKRAALKTHPDRVPVDSPERVARTRKFQLVNDAYFTLSDPARRREYDAQRKLFGGGRSAGAGFGASSPNMPGGFDTDADDTDNATNDTAGGAYSWAWNFFTGQNTNANTNAAGTGAGNNREQQRAQTEDAQFADVFEEMLREEGLAEPATGRPTGKFWALLGGLSGGALGFIVANVPGLLAGAVAGNRLGAVRDAKGKSVYAVFQDLPQDDRAKLLSQLAARVFSHAVGI
ncbi:DnaJ domain-containing protein, partial [Lasiosphaeria miniovina]